MDTLRKSGRATAAANDTRQLHLGGNGRHVRQLGRLRWHPWHGGAVLVTWLAVGTLFLHESVQATSNVTSQAAAGQSDHGADNTVARNGVSQVPSSAEDKTPLESSMEQSLVQSMSSALPLPFLSPSATLHTLWATRGASASPKHAERHTKYKQSGAEHILTDVRGAGAEEKEKEHELEELQSQCAQLKLDCSWVRKVVSDYLRKNAVAWTPMTRAAVNTALKKIAEVVHESEHQQVVDGTALLTNSQLQRGRLALQAQRLLEEHVQPRQSSSLHENMQGLMRREEAAAKSAQTVNAQSSAEATDDERNARTAKTASIKKPMTADTPSGDTPADSLKNLLHMIDNVKSEEGRAGADNQKVFSGNTVDAEEAQLLSSETGDSSKQNTALRPLLVLPWRREIRGAVADSDGMFAIGGNPDDAQTTMIPENESDSEDAERSLLKSDLVESASGSERSDERRNNPRGIVTSNESTVIGSTHPLLQRPHHTIHFFLRPDAGATENQMRNSRRGLTVGQLETLLQSRSQQRHRRPPLRPVIFPSCYFDAPMQKRMREKAALLAASLEQLNDAVEALTELGVVVEKQAELVEKAAFTVVYRDRLLGGATSTTKPRTGDDFESENNSDTPSEENIEEAEEVVTRTKKNRSSMRFFRISRAQSGSSSGEEKLFAATSEAQRAPTETGGPEAQMQYQDLQSDEDTYKKLLGANGVRKQLRELFASWELARRAAGASEMPNEIMRRAEALRREFVLPLQQDLQQLNLLDATLSLNHVALQRLLGCRGFINAVRRTISRAEEDLYNLGAHAFASEVSLPLMAHDLQLHVADLLEHVVQLQLQHHRALHVKAASLISLHREFFRSARELQQEATARLKDGHLLLAMSPEEWHEIAQRLNVGVFQLRVDLARQLVALKSVDKKAARLEGILNILQGGLEHLLHIEVQLQHIRKNNRMRRAWFALDEDEKDLTDTENGASGSLAEKLTNAQMPPEKKDHDAAAVKGRDGRQNGSTQNVFPHQHARVFANADEALSLELPPKIQGGSFGSLPTDVHGETAEQDEKAMKILQRLLGGVLQMAEFLQMYKQQSSDAEQLLRNRFHIAQESVQKATGVAQMIMGQPHASSVQRQDLKLRHKVPAWARSLHRHGFNRARSEEELKDSAALVRHVKEKVRLLDAALFALEEPPLEEKFATGRDVVARLDRINSHFFKEIQRKRGSRSAIAGPFCAWRKRPVSKKPTQKTQAGQ